MNAVMANGLDGVTVAHTELSDVDGERGRLIIRGYDVEELVETATFEDVGGLVWSGTWPTGAAQGELQAALAHSRLETLGSRVAFAGGL